MRPLIEGRGVVWRDQVAAECSLHRRFGVASGIEGRMLRTKRWKYIVYSGGTLREQLFDLEQDPGEMKNLAVEPQYKTLLDEYRRRLAAQIKKTGDAFTVPGISYDGWILSGSGQLP